MHPLELFKFCPVCGSPHFEIHNEKSKKCADCGFVYYFNSSAATVAFILNGKGELLVEGSVTLGFIDSKTRHPVRCPEKLAEIIKANIDND